jgi:Binding-protein-dependent transport system inner membrane component
VAGTALYMFYLRAEFWLDRDITSTLEVLVAAHVLLTIPWTVRLVTASLEGLDQAAEEAAANLGAGPFTVFSRVTLPAMRPGIIVADSVADVGVGQAGRWRMTPSGRNLEEIRRALPSYQVVVGMTEPGQSDGMTSDLASYPGYRFPAEIISHAVWLYHVFSLSLRDVELILAERGITVTHESIRSWCRKFGSEFARKLRRRRPKPGDT